MCAAGPHDEILLLTKADAEWVNHIAISGKLELKGGSAVELRHVVASRHRNGGHVACIVHDRHPVRLAGVASARRRDGALLLTLPLDLLDRRALLLNLLLRCLLLLAAGRSARGGPGSRQSPAPVPPPLPRQRVPRLPPSRTDGYHSVVGNQMTRSSLLLSQDGRVECEALTKSIYGCHIDTVSLSSSLVLTGPLMHTCFVQ